MSRRPSSSRELDELLFILLLGVVSTTLGYQFGFGNQTEHIPLVLRLLDPSALQGDFFVDSASAFGPRFYYVHFLAFFARFAPLPIVVLATTLAVNTSLVAVTHMAARDLLRGDKLAGFIAAILVVSVSSFPLGLVTDIRFQDLQPGSLAIPGCLAAVWAGLRGKPVLAAALAAVSSLPHPLYGVETGAVAVGTAFFARLLEPSSRSIRERLGPSLVRCMAGSTVLLGVTLVFWVLPALGQSGEPLTTHEIVDILAHFRAPHHYLPSLFPTLHYAALGLFLGAVGVSWWTWREVQAGAPETMRFLIPPTVILLGCLAGYLLVEVWPSRLGMTAQPFRLLYLVKWLGLLFFGWLIARWLGDVRPRPCSAWIALLGSGAAQAPIAFLTVLAERFDTRLRRAHPSLPIYAMPALAFAAALPLLARAGKPDETLQVAIAMAIALPLCRGTPALWKRVLPVSIVALLVLGAGVNRSLASFEWRVLDPIVTWGDHRGDDADTARWVRENTPEAAMFLIPPGLSAFRMLARRPVVVDFKALPFEDSAMREWRSRIRECYGEVTGGGFAARDQMDQHYRQIGDEALEAIAARYDATYAVLHAESPTARPVLYANASYKVVALE